MNLESHPVANCFRLLKGCEFELLVNDIREKGLIDPIVLYQGMILDGRNRYRACEVAGVEPRFVEYEGDDPAGFAISRSKRRNDSESQKAMAAARLSNTEWGGDRKSDQSRNSDFDISAEAAAEKYGISRDQVFVAKKVAKHRGGVFVDLVDDYDVAVSFVERIINEPLNVADLTAEYIKERGMKPTQALREARRFYLPQVELPEGQYRVIYADPPWKYGDEKDHAAGMSAADHYPTMPTKDICELDVPGLCADDAVLFMWGTFPLLPDALEVIKAWGFTYKTALVWWKQRSNFGNYHNASAELLFIATKGSCTPDVSERVDQVQAIKREGRHSEKPEAFREIIDRLYNHGPRIELFRRGDAPPGWHVFGNEAAA